VEQQLFQAVRAVGEGQVLTSVFRKLSVRDRTQLVVLFHAQPSAAPGRQRFEPALRA